jgi:hypothetical protein
MDRNMVFIVALWLLFEGHYFKALLLLAAAL